MTRPNIKHPAPKGKNMLKQVDHNRFFFVNNRNVITEQMHLRACVAKVWKVNSSGWGDKSIYKKRQKSNIALSECRDGNPFDLLVLGLQIFGRGDAGLRSGSGAQFRPSDCRFQIRRRQPTQRTGTSLRCNDMHRNILGGINRKSSSFIKRTLWSRFCIWGFCAQPRPRSVQVDVQVRVSQVPRLPWISLPKVGRGTWLSPSALFKGLWLCCAQWLWWAGTRHWAQIVWIFWIFLSRTFILYNRQTE